MYARDLGIIARDSPIRFANEIYQEIATRIMNSSFQESFNQDEVEPQWYVKADGRLDMDKLLRAFVEFYRENSESWIHRFQYREAGHQLLIMAFLQRIINGGGRINREMAAGRGRTDIVVEWAGEKFVLELKLQYNEKMRDKGKEQLSRYLSTLELEKGYLILFELKSTEKIPWEERLKWDDELYEDKQMTIIEL